jgi:hypothetical protein
VGQGAPRKKWMALCVGLGVELAGITWSLLDWLRCAP